MLHMAIESPIQKLPNKPLLPKVRIKHTRTVNKKLYLSKPFNRQAIVGIRNTSKIKTSTNNSNWNNYLSQIKSSTSSFKGSNFIETNAWTSVLSANEKFRKYNLKCESALKLRDLGISKTVIKNYRNNQLVSANKRSLKYTQSSSGNFSPDNKDYFARSSKIKKQRKSKMVRYQEKMNQKIRVEYNIKNWKEDRTTVTSKQSSMVYGERMFMSKYYKNKPKFLQNLNSTLSPRKEFGNCMTPSSGSVKKMLQNSSVKPN